LFGKPKGEKEEPKKPFEATRRLAEQSE